MSIEQAGQSTPAPRQWNEGDPEPPHDVTLLKREDGYFARRVRGGHGWWFVGDVHEEIPAGEDGWPWWHNQVWPLTEVLPPSSVSPSGENTTPAGKDTGEDSSEAQGAAEPEYVTVPITPQYLATRAIANIIDEHFGDDYEAAAWAAAEEIVRQGYAYPRLVSPLSREELGHRVADVCIQWSREDDEREGASATWDALNSHRRELYMRVGEALFGLGMTWSPAPSSPLPEPEGPSPWDAYVKAYREYQDTDPHGAVAHPTAHHMHALEAALRVAGSPLPDSETEWEWGCGSALDEVFGMDEETARQYAETTGVLRKRRSAGPWIEVTS